MGASYPIASGDSRLAALVDALEALSLLSPDDASYPWDLGLILEVAGLQLGAAHAYLEAAVRFESEASGDASTTGDEQEWAAEALSKAAKCFVAAGSLASAFVLLPRLAPDARAEIEALVDSVVSA